MMAYTQQVVCTVKNISNINLKLFCTIFFFNFQEKEIERCDVTHSTAQHFLPHLVPWLDVRST